MLGGDEKDQVEHQVEAEDEEDVHGEARGTLPRLKKRKNVGIQKRKTLDEVFSTYLVGGEDQPQLGGQVGRHEDQREGQPPAFHLGNGKKFTTSSSPRRSNIFNAHR